MVTAHVPAPLVNLNVRIAPDLYREVAQLGVTMNRYGGRHGRADLQGATAKLLALGLVAHKLEEKKKREEEGPHGPLFKAGATTAKQPDPSDLSAPCPKCGRSMGEHDGRKCPPPRSATEARARKAAAATPAARKAAAAAARKPAARKPAARKVRKGAGK